MTFICREANETGPLPSSGLSLTVNTASLSSEYIDRNGGEKMRKGRIERMTSGNKSDGSQNLIFCRCRCVTVYQ